MPRVLAALLIGCADPAPPTSPIQRVVTFNVGTTEGLDHDAGPDDGYSQAHATASDAWYGDSLAWLPAVDAATALFAQTLPDVVGLQEIFDGSCADIPAEYWPDFVCSDPNLASTHVAEQILGPDYQVACHRDKPDKCLGVHARVGQLRGCDGGLCLDGLDGGTIDGCGSGSRVGRAVIDLADGGEITVVHLHGTSGLTLEDQDCRTAQIDQIFVDLDGGGPAATGDAVLVLGDLNTDPGRWSTFDASAARWNESVGGALPFQWITEVGPDAPLTYQGVATIDHVASSAWTGSCVHPGITDADPVTDAVYFDHAPAICTLALR